MQVWALQRFQAITDRGTFRFALDPVLLDQRGVRGAVEREAVKLEARLREQGHYVLDVQGRVFCDLPLVGWVEVDV
jgi:hypothetical protein